MPAIKKAYKRMYGVDLATDISNKCGREAGPLISQIAMTKTGAKVNYLQHIVNDYICV